MEDCDKYRRKAIVGLILIVSLFILPLIIKRYFDSSWFILIIPIVGVVSIFLYTPYIKCLSNNNKKLKPPFGK